MAIIRTFRDFVATEWAERHSENDNVDVQWAVYDQSVWQHVERIRADPELHGHASVVADSLAHDILLSFLGHEWIAENVAVADITEDLISKLKALPVIHKKRELARRIYEFQSFPWFDHFLKHVKSNDVTSALFEADTLAALMSIPAKITRTEESGNRGSDFDVSLFLSSERIVPVEAKAKLDSTPFTKRTVTNTLKSAAKQLPKGSVGWVFMRIPWTWIGSRLEDEYPEAIYEGIRQTSRIGTAFSAVDKVHINSDQSAATIRRVWHLYLSEDLDGWLRELSITLFRFLENEFNNFAPRAPF
jgi:hypothetical protein